MNFPINKNLHIFITIYIGIDTYISMCIYRYILIHIFLFVYLCVFLDGVHQVRGWGMAIPSKDKPNHRLHSIGKEGLSLLPPQLAFKTILHHSRDHNLKGTSRATKGLEK